MTSITIKGKTYTLRYDMSVAEWIEERYGDARQAFGQMKGSRESIPIITGIFCAMANAANDYRGISDRYSEVDTVIIDKHTSPGRISVIMKAIMGAFADGNKMQAEDDADAEIRDDYLRELREEEKSKN